MSRLAPLLTAPEEAKVKLRVKLRNAERHGPETVSPLAWAEQYASVISPTEGRMPFVPYSYQAALLNDASPRRIVLKARQTGMSNAIALEALHLAVTRPDSTVLFVSRNGDAARQLVTYCYAAMVGMPTPPVVTENQTAIAFGNGSRILSLPANPSTGRGQAATAVYLDEFAFSAYDELVYQSLIGTVSTGGRVTILSTPNGRANVFFRIWSGFEAGEWSRHSIHWSDCPRYDEAWAERTRQGMTRQAFATEYDLDFATSGDAVFRPEDLEQALVGWNGDHHGCTRLIHAWDIGRRQDNTVGLTLGSRGGLWHVVAFERFLAPYPVIQARIEQRQKTMGGETWVESNGVGDPVIENLSIQVQPFTTTPRSKMQAIQSLQLLLEKGRLKHGHEQLGRELALYEWIDHALVQDCVIAAAIAAHAAEQPQPRPFAAAAGGTRPMIAAFGAAGGRRR